jgi:hypothetical protein
MKTEPTQRISDAEREIAIQQLQVGHSEGRLNIDEFNTRLDAAYRARTHGEIIPLVADLPRPKNSSRTPAKARRRLRRRAVNFLGANAVVWGIWGAQELNGQSLHDLWPVWVTIPWGTWLVYRTVRYWPRRD